MFALINTVIVAVLFYGGTTAVSYTVGYGLYVSYALAIAVPSWALTVRRLHDVGKSGWWIFINLIPLVGGIWFFVLTVLDSKPGDNQYGPSPKGAGATPSAPASM